MIIELVQKNDARYQETCFLADNIYRLELGVSPTSFPPSYLILLDGDIVVGGLGFWSGDQKEEFLTERYCSKTNLSGFFPDGIIPSREHLGEICSYFLLKPYRKEFFCTILSAMVEYVWVIDINFLFVIKIPTVQKQFNHLGIKLMYLCDPDINKYDGSELDKSRWLGRYFKLNPKCCLIDVYQALLGIGNRRSNPYFLPSFEYGDKLSFLLGKGQ